MRISTVFLSVALASFAFAQSNSPIVFSPDPLQIGTIDQGEQRKVELKGKNTSAQEVVLETVMSQNVGPKDIVAPKKIGAGADFSISFTMDTRYMEGSFTHNIILVTPKGEAWPTWIEGNVKAPIRFSEPMIDLGYYEIGKAQKFMLYAWNPDGKNIDLKPGTEFPKGIIVNFEKVALDVSKPDEIKEGGSNPGLKISLNIQSLPETGTRMSIRQLLPFQSSAYPNATPEIMLVGYWKTSAP